MKCELDKVSGFTAWYAKKESEMRKDDAMSLMKAKRRMTIHIKPVRVAAVVTVTANENIVIKDRLTVAASRIDETGEPQLILQTGPSDTELKPEWLWYFEEMPGKDVLTACQEHLLKLKSLVEECGAHFG